LESDSDKPYFCYSATLRVMGDGINFEELETQIGVQATEKYKKGTSRRPGSPPAAHDMWLYKAPVAEHQLLGDHINALWKTIEPAKSFLLSLKKTCTVDVFLGYRSSSDHAGFEVPYQSLEMFRDLEIPFGVSVIIA
jgi:Domain of unknown function (DUF4279)